MPEPINNPVTPAGQQAATPVTPANENELGKNGNEGSKSGVADFDHTKLSDEQLNKVLEDQRLWNTPRLKELREAAKKAKEYEAEKAKQAESDQIKKGEFEKVLADKEAKIQELTAQLQNGQLDNTLRGELQKSGVKNIEAALKLVDKSGLKIGETGKIEGLDEALQNVKQIAPEIFNNNSKSVGSGTNPVNPGSGEPVKMSNLRDPQWYNAPENQGTVRDIRTGKIQVIDD